MAVTRGCPACGLQGLPERSRFCLQCGAELPRLGAEPEERPDLPYTPPHLARDILTARSTREGERKEVCVLFADIAGSLAMAESLDPEDIHTIMDGFFALALEAIHAQHGRINQFRGDGFMALFGAPRASGDEAVRGLRAALAIRSAVSAHARLVEERFGVPFLLRMGLHTGTVWVGSIGSELRRDYTAEGPTVGLAARLEQTAEPGQILLSEETARRARPFFRFRELGARTLRGIRSPVRVLELEGAGPYAHRLDAERARGLTPFVGRRQALERLGALATPGRPTAAARVAITGEAGIGKSRLVFEHVSHLPNGVTLLEARCSEDDVARAHAPWLQMLRRWPSDLRGRGAAASLREGFERAPEATITREQFAEKLCALLAGVAREQPLLIVIEDTQWLDVSSRLALTRLAEEALPSLVVLTTERREPTATEFEDAGTARLRLGRLEPSECEALARSLLSDMDDPEPLIGLATQRGGGNPLFIEEVGRTLREGASELRRAARLEMELRRAGPGVPETLRGVIAARIDALADGDKELLESASVLDPGFEPDLLGKLIEAPAEELDDAIDRLLRRGLLVRSDARALEFRHVLTREVAYDQIILSRRRRLHARCARLLERSGIAVTPLGASRLGFHHDRAADPEKAAHFLAEAGSGYLRLNAPDEAAVHLERAWELHQKELHADPGTRIRVGLALGSALNGLDRAGEAMSVFDALEQEDLAYADRRRLAAAFVEGGWARFSEMQDVAGACGLIERGLELVEGLHGAERVRLAGHAHLARIQEAEGRVAEALGSAEEVVELATAAGDRFFRAFGLGSRGSTLVEAGQAEEALAACEAAAALAEETGNEVAIGFAQMFLAKVRVQRREAEAALAALERAWQAGERTQQVGTLFQATSLRGETYLLLGDRARAMREFESLAELNTRWPAATAHLAQGHLALGRHEEAIKLSRRCLAQDPPRAIRARILRTLGLALGRSDPEHRAEAEATLAESIELCERLGLRPSLADAKLARAEVCARHGEEEQARNLAAEAARILEACGLPRRAAQAVSGF